MNLKELIEKLRGFSTPELCDGAGPNQVICMDYKVKPMVTRKKIVGDALTVNAPRGVSGIVLDALDVVQEGQIIVIAGQGECNRSYWGDIRSTLAKKKGVEGVVIGGAFRDFEDCEKVGLPIYAKAIIPMSAKKEHEGKLNVPVICGGIQVSPGDIIVGDVNGVCAIHPEDAEDIMRRAMEKRNIDEQMKLK